VSGLVLFDLRSDLSDLRLIYSLIYRENKGKKQHPKWVLTQIYLTKAVGLFEIFVILYRTRLLIRNEDAKAERNINIGGVLGGRD
jgi:hypothetical protein